MAVWLVVMVVGLPTDLSTVPQILAVVVAAVEEVGWVESLFFRLC
jgi:hypothetical protein